MFRKTCKVYYDIDTREIADVTKCCNKMNNYLKLDIIFLTPDDLFMVSHDTTRFKYCPECGARIIIKPSRL